MNYNYLEIKMTSTESVLLNGTDATHLEADTFAEGENLDTVKFRRRGKKYIFLQEIENYSTNNECMINFKFFKYFKYLLIFIFLVIAENFDLNSRKKRYKIYNQRR